ncbi:flagellar hook-basal body complex protein [Acetobacterium wieringae]|uniref:flagellar hook-basal body complex protein n=1 Tax=Acetobacterium wieringae TaxID=52694 RepID=UPI002B1F6D70|nr:flagellar hook-basal body complex protein [Acetobacterium wieringae]MEA4804411.1 flagellar hook-basal body complex protein [Acetobacterium wieringae]
MIRSLYSGISGMAAHQTKLNVIGNNIANVNTYGFKASRVVFSDVLYQNLSTATEATNTTGGTNASQLGYGAKVASIDMLNTISSGASTGRALDVYIAGEGYLVVQPEAGSNRYTRVGNLKFDALGNLTDGAGSKVMGIPLDADNNPVLDANGTLAIDDLQAINVPPAELAKYTGITIGKSGEITGIKAGDPEFTKASGFSWLNSVTVPEDSNYTGNVELMVGYTVSVDSTSGDFAGAFTIPPTTDIIGTLSIAKSGSSYVIGEETELTDTNEDPFTAYGTPSVSSAGILTFSGMPGLKIDTSQFTGDGPFNATIIPSDEVTVLATIKTQGGVTEYLSVPEDWEFDAENPNIALTGESGSINLNVDATEFANLLDLDTSGGLPNTIIGKIEAGSDKPVTLGYLALGKFANNDGLLQDGNGYFMESANSGTPIATKAGTNGTGGTESANLEMSNVDLSQEFTDMIVAQRGFQANSRIITVSDSILEELINLKR